jgi:hypothetical protein
MSARRSVILFVMVVLGPGLVGGDEFRTPAGCHVTFPGKGRKQTTYEERSPYGGWLTVQVQEEEQGSYMVAWFDLTRPANAEAIEAVLKGTLADNASARGYKLLSETKRNLNDRVPGYELVLEKKSNVIRFRTWFVGTRVFQVVVSGQKAWVESDEATKYLNSFNLNN